MEKTIMVDKETGYKIKQAVESFHKDLVVVVDQDRITIKELSKEEVMRGIETMAKCTDKLEAIRYERFLKEYRERHPEV